MELKKKKLLTIISESTLENLLIQDIKRLGARGYTLTQAEGEGARGVRTGDWDQNKNVSIQIICSETLGHSILQHIFDTYYEDYALVAFLSDIEVYRDAKF